MSTQFHCIFQHMPPILLSHDDDEIAIISSVFENLLRAGLV